MSAHTLSSQSVLLLLTLGVKATHPIPGKVHNFPTAIPAPISIGGHKPQSGTTFCPLGRQLSHRERGQIHNFFREAAEVCLGDCQVRESSKDTSSVVLLLVLTSQQGTQVPRDR